MPDLPPLITKPIDPDLISREAAAAILKVGIRKLDRMAAHGVIPTPYRFNPKCVMFSRREIEAAAARGVDLEDKRRRKVLA